MALNVCQLIASIGIIALLALLLREMRRLSRAHITHREGVHQRSVKVQRELAEEVLERGHAFLSAALDEGQAKGIGAPAPTGAKVVPLRRAPNPGPRDPEERETRFFDSTPPGAA